MTLSPDRVSEVIMFLSCPSSTFVHLSIHLDRSCYLDLMNSFSNRDETYRQYLLMA